MSSRREVSWGVTSQPTSNASKWKSTLEIATIDTRTPTSMRSLTSAQTLCTPSKYSSQMCDLLSPMSVDLNQGYSGLQQDTADSWRQTTRFQHFSPPVEPLRLNFPRSNLDTESQHSNVPLSDAGSKQMRPSTVSALAVFEPMTINLSPYKKFEASDTDFEPLRLRKPPIKSFESKFVSARSASLESMCDQTTISRSNRSWRTPGLGRESDEGARDVEERSTYFANESFAHAVASPESQVQPCTTLMLRNLPNKCTASTILGEIRDRGFIVDINFFYLPIDGRRKRPAAYCFVNLTSAEVARRFREVFDGLTMHGVENSTVCHVATGNVQGLKANIKSYEDSHVMKLDEDCQPLILNNGELQPIYRVQEFPHHQKLVKTYSEMTSVSSQPAVVDDANIVDPADATTLMLRGIPNKYTKHLLLEDLEERGVLVDIDFLYLPIDLRYGSNVGYCFVNLTSKDAVSRFFTTFVGTTLDKVKSGKSCNVTVGRIQGQQANIELYRDTSVMRMRDDYRPMILKDGKEETFPVSALSRQELFACSRQRTGVSSRSRA